jgi:hypothetical protein
VDKPPKHAQHVSVFPAPPAAAVLAHAATKRGSRGNRHAVHEINNPQPHFANDDPHIDVAALMGESSSTPMDERRKLMAEVREHLELLKEFEGAISEEELAERKRQLFLAMPAAPPPLPASASKKQRLT